jgi:hypothetical protein
MPPQCVINKDSLHDGNDDDDDDILYITPILIALRLAGNRSIDVGLFVYICIEAWSSEIAQVERHIAASKTSSSRKLGMAIPVMSRQEIRELTVSEKELIADIVRHYVTQWSASQLRQEGTDGSEGNRSRGIIIQPAQLPVGVTLGVSASSSCFESVSAISKRIDWRETKRLYAAFKSNADGAGQTSNNHNNSGGSAAAAAAGSHAEVFVHYLRVEMEQIMAMSDVEISYHVDNVVRSVIKPKLWARLMSEACGWRDEFGWKPIILSSKAAADAENLRHAGATLGDLVVDGCQQLVRAHNGLLHHHRFNSARELQSDLYSDTDSEVEPEQKESDKGEPRSYENRPYDMYNAVFLDNHDMLSCSVYSLMYLCASYFIS